MIQQIFNFDLNIFEYLVKKTWADDFAGMDRDNGAATVGVLEEMMAALDPNDPKARVMKSSY